MEKIKHKYEWYLYKTDEHIYDDDVVEYLTPRISKAKQTLASIKEVINQITLSENIVNDYLEIGEALSVIETILETKEYE